MWLEQTAEGRVEMRSEEADRPTYLRASKGPGLSLSEMEALGARRDNAGFKRIPLAASAVEHRLYQAKTEAGRAVRRLLKQSRRAVVASARRAAVEVIELRVYPESKANRFCCWIWTNATNPGYFFSPARVSLRFSLTRVKLDL